MHKKLAFGVGLLLISSPLIASAQTTSSFSIFAAIGALLDQIETELQQLFTQSSAPVSLSQTASTTAAATSKASSQCSQFADLKSGDTDATTNGEVSQLQSFLGISPTTGTYGAQTFIGYKNKCGNLGNSQPVSVPGMSEYTDSSFGFSFWYPNSWDVSTVARSQYTGEGEINKTIAITNPQGEIVLDEVNDPNGAITVGNPTKTGENEDYYFSVTSGVWVYETDQTSGGGYLQSRSADVSDNTMGGLHMFTGGGTFGENIAVPLSVANFVVAEATGENTEPLMATIIATSPVVATPVSTAQQTAVIEAEANAYAVSTSNTSATNTLGFSASPTSGLPPLTVSFDMPAFFNVGGQETAWTTLDNGDGDIYVSGSPASETYDNIGCTAQGYDSSCSGTHTYTSPGGYSARLEDASGKVFATETITVTNPSASSLQTYTNSQYGYSFQYPNNMILDPSNWEDSDAWTDRLCESTTSCSTYFGVKVSTDASDVGSCLAVPEGVTMYRSSSVKNVAINGATFLSYDTSGVWTGHTDASSEYKIVHNGACITIDSQYEYLSQGSPDQTTETSITNIIQSFRFTQ